MARHDGATYIKSGPELQAAGILVWQASCVTRRRLAMPRIGEAVGTSVVLDLCSTWLVSLDAIRAAIRNLQQSGPSMRSIAGALLILTSEQAFAHAHMANFPNEPRVREVLYPAAGLLLAIGTLLLVWGLYSDRRTAAPGA